jgi:hypothetical protein
VLEPFIAQQTTLETLRRVRMNYEEQISHKLGQKDGADFAANATPEQLANVRRTFGDNAEAILLNMHAKTRATSFFGLSGYFALAILGDDADRWSVEDFWRPYLTGEAETDEICNEPYYLLGFIRGALAARTTIKAHQTAVTSTSLLQS